MSAKAQQDTYLIDRQDFEPAYLALFRRGVLGQRAQHALDLLTECQLCPRACKADRHAQKKGVCQTGRLAMVSSYFPHLGEEDCLRGWRGSGTIFFSSCNLRCVFCQNHDISQERYGRPVSPEHLAQMMLELQAMGCHNINWVTPSHVVPQLLEALLLAVEGGLDIPLVYNTSAFDSLEALRLLEGVVDIYMPDFKIWDPDLARRLLTAEEYPAAARAALREMHRQVGPLKMDARGLALRGVLVRHLVMPNGVAGTPDVMRFLAQELSAQTYVNIMAQYRPANKVCATQFPEINRRITEHEFREAYQAARAAGLWRFDERRLF
jgi:putative pyruvate formate lyase activating enzyme